MSSALLVVAGLLSPVFVLVFETGVHVLGLGDEGGLDRTPKLRRNAVFFLLAMWLYFLDASSTCLVVFKTEIGYGVYFGEKDRRPPSCTRENWCVVALVVEEGI